MTGWTQAELDELGPGLRGYVEGWVPRGTAKPRYTCANCGEKFGAHPGTRSRFCRECRPQEQLRAAREGMRRLRRRRQSA